MSCDSVNNQQTLGISPEAESLHSILGSTSPVAVAYQVFVLNFTSPRQIDVKFNVRPLIHLGLCVPRSCNPRGLYQSVSDYLEKSQEGGFYGIQNVTVHYHKEGLDKKWALLQIPEFHLLCILAGVSIGLSMIYRIIFKSRKDENGNVLVATRDCENVYQSTKESPEGIEQICRCFSLKENNQKLFNCETPAKEIRAINGIR